jgi:hypothetical protein
MTPAATMRSSTMSGRMSKSVGQTIVFGIDLTQVALLDKVFGVRCTEMATYVKSDT